RATYDAQLRAYAAVRQPALPPGTAIRLALFYPLMDRLIWWPYEDTASATTIPEEEPQPANDKGQFSLF
ncbi:MAG TPA: hypothetical protein VIM67_11970, partial [Terriglobus sp.]